MSLGASCGMCGHSCNVVAEYFLLSSVRHSELRRVAVVELIMIDLSVPKEQLFVAVEFVRSVTL